MPKTPLLDSLRRLFRDLRASRQTGIPVREIQERRALLTRRQFVAGATAGAAALALPRRVRAAAGQPTIAIVGAGIAGLACALDLADKGIASTVYEASGRVGGRMFSNDGGYWDAGQVSEWCGELIDTGHKTIRALAHRFGLPLDDLHAAETPGSTETYRFFGDFFPKTAADADFLEIDAALTADLKAAGFPTLFNSATAAGTALDHMSVFDWIESRVPGGHATPLGALLDTAYAIEYGADTPVQSSLNLVYLLGFQPTANSFDIFGTSDERFHIRGGNQGLPRAIAAALGGDVVKTGWRLTRIAKTPDGRTSLSFDVGAQAQEVVADFVVLAIPFAVLRDLDYSQAGFDALKVTAIQELGRGHNGKMHLQFTNRLWTTPGPWGVSTGTSYSDSGYQSGWEVSRAQPGTPGILVCYSGGSVTDAMRTNAAFVPIGQNPRVAQDATNSLAQLEPTFPGVSALWNGKATQSLPHLSSFFNSSYSYWRVGQYTAFSGYEAVPQGNILFCGEHTSIDFQGFMEGGASTGQRAALELRALLRGPG